MEIVLPNGRSARAYPAGVAGLVIVNNRDIDPSYYYGYAWRVMRKFRGRYTTLTDYAFHTIREAKEAALKLDLGMDWRAYRYIPPELDRAWREATVSIAQLGTHVHWYTDLRKVYCSECNHVITGDIHWHSDMPYCSNCSATCCMCRQACPKSCLESIDGQYYCHGCCSQCDDCLEYTTDAIFDYDTTVCQSCYEDYFRCNDCRCLVHGEVACFDGDDALCETCYTDRARGNIRSYSYKPTPVFFWSRDRERRPTLFMGVELEVECESNGKSARAIEDYGRDDIFYLKDDGSLDNGFEVVSHPCSLKYHLEEFGWPDILQELITSGAKSHDVNTCGLHVHISRDALTESEQVKLAWFVHSQEGLIEQLARRTSEYAKMVSKDKPRKGDNHNQDRYEAVNFQNDNTIEFRVFKGTLRIETFFATLELVQAIVDYIKKNGSTHLLEKSRARQEFVDLVKRSKYEYLKDYLEYRGVTCAS